MSAVVLAFPRADRCHASQLPEALLRSVRCIAKGNGCTALQIIDVETTAAFWLRQGMAHDEVVKRARARARLLSGRLVPDGSAA